MTSHGMARDANPTRVEFFEARKESVWHFFRDVAIHLVALGPRLLGSIDIEPCSTAEVIRIVFALDLQTA